MQKLLPNNVPNTTDEEDWELAEDEDIYCISKSKTVDNIVNDNPLPPDDSPLDDSPFKTITYDQFDTLKT